MDPKYFTLILFFGYLNNKVFSDTATITTDKPQYSFFISSVSHVSANSRTISGNSLGHPAQFNSIPPAQPILPTKTTTGQPIPSTPVPPGKSVAHATAGLPAYNITKPPVLTANISFPQTALPAFTSARQLSPSTHRATRQPATPVVYTPTQQPLSPVHTSSGKPVLPTVGNLSTQSTSVAKNLPRNTPGFITETISDKGIPNKSNHSSTAAILVVAILTSMLVVIVMIVLWKCLRKPVLRDQNWAGRSPFADGETPDICMDNIRESEVSTKRTSIVSFMAWKPSNSTLLADNLETKLFESSENIEDVSNPKIEKTKDQVNGTSEDSADGSTIGTAVSTSEDADLPLPPPFLDLEGQESIQSDQLTMVTVTPLTNDSTNLQPSSDSLYQACEDPNSEAELSLPPAPDLLNLPLPQVDFTKNQEDSNCEIQCCELFIPPDPDQDLNESLPPPPAELL
ncbi:protein EVI2B [Ctenodactylus gundi]